MVARRFDNSDRQAQEHRKSGSSEREICATSTILDYDLVMGKSFQGKGLSSLRPRNNAPATFEIQRRAAMKVLAKEGSYSAAAHPFIADTHEIIPEVIRIVALHDSNWGVDETAKVIETVPRKFDPDQFEQNFVLEALIYAKSYDKIHDPEVAEKINEIIMQKTYPLKADDIRFLEQREPAADPNEIVVGDSRKFTGHVINAVLEPEKSASTIITYAAAKDGRDAAELASKDMLNIILRAMQMTGE